MHLCLISLCIILNLQLLSTYPIGTGLTDTDMDILNLLLHRLQESFSEHDGLDSLYTGKGGDGRQPQTGLDEAAIKEFFSAKNLKSLRNDSSRRSSGCFGRRMDRIGSMSSLGCNTVGRYSKIQ
ncbi:natriuretic peptides B isoform X1 [Platichthys flesus]|uniref:natriuretic peptides B isoform X1 n=1 Tax=Platichthys flesus TaxID=8260 RepID=UPI002DBFE17E|nr:natriuretic peptides B isoform X1 [Platichthys flesus]